MKGRTDLVLVACDLACSEDSLNDCMCESVCVCGEGKLMVTIDGMVYVYGECNN